MGGGYEGCCLPAQIRSDPKHPSNPLLEPFVVARSISNVWEPRPMVSRRHAKDPSPQRLYSALPHEKQNFAPARCPSAEQAGHA
jgi:hypothetical protein